VQCSDGLVGYDAAVPANRRSSMQVRFALVAGVLSAALALAAPASAGISKKANAQKVVAFMDMVFNQKKVKEGFDKYVGDKYIQHNPIAPDGKDAAVEVLGKALEMLPGWSYEFKHAYVDGDIVVLHSHVRMKADDRGMAVVDIFRFEKGKIVEHWDVVQPIPEKSANNNTMF
jgi:predicted SnoaL-like aldol condensation-catalyzing enzyme